jgi:hypothetical protein
MNPDEVPIGRLVSAIVTVLAVALVLSIGGLVALGLAGGDDGVQGTLTHITETVVGVFVGIAAGRLASGSGRAER